MLPDPVEAIKYIEWNKIYFQKKELSLYWDLQSRVSDIL